MSELRFDDRVAVVTGGGRGLGRAYALLLASRGAKIVVNDVGAGMSGDGVDSSAAADVVAEIRAAGGEAVASIDSVATPEGGKSIVATALENFGRLDILIHSAGNIRRGLLTELEHEDFDNVLDVHLRGAFHVVREALPLMVQAGFGRIVLTSSINGIYGKANNANYSTAKAGLIGLSHSIGIEGASSGVTSNVIIPAAVTRMSEGIDTSNFPPMEPDMVSPMVAWLCHERCEISGEMFVAMGGRMARAFIAENHGVFRPHWTVEQVAEDIAQIRDTTEPIIFQPVPDGQLDHLRFGFAMASQTIEQPNRK